MITSQNLDRCIDLLAHISNGAPNDIKTMALEIGYILKQELEVVKGIESRHAGHGNVSPQELLNDNVQLFNENQRLIRANVELKSMLESRINSIAGKMNMVCDEISGINNTLRSVVTR